jgi:MFS family permease
MNTRRADRPLVATAAALVLADASIVALALPPILAQMHTTVTGVAAVVGVYALVLAAAILPAERVVARYGPSRAGAAGLALFAAASIACAAASALTPLLVFRALQAAGGAVGLLAAFDILGAGASAHGRRLWLGAALAGTAAGPALGGALTEALDWRAIFAVQAPLAAAAALGCAAARMSAADARAAETAPAGTGVRPAGAPPGAAARPAGAPPGAGVRPAGAPPGAAARPAGAPPGAGVRPAGAPSAAAAHLVPARPATAPAHAARLASLALVSAAFTAVLFLLVLELVVGFAISPLRAAAAVTVLPLAALAGGAIRAEPQLRAAIGATLLAGGAGALALLPEPSIGWTVVPQLLAGAGMGLALPAFAGELLPERTTSDAARVLVARHVGIVVVLAILAPVVSSRLDSLTDSSILKGTALVLDAPLPPQDKLTLAPTLFAGVNAEQPRAGLRKAIDARRATLGGPAYDRLATRLDDVLVGAVQSAFKSAYAIAAALALVAAALLVRAALALAAAVLLAGACVAVYAVEHNRRAPPDVVLQDPCRPRAIPNTGGLTGFLQQQALKQLDRAACKYGSTREELVLALADKQRAREYRQRYGVDPRSVAGLLGLLTG